jgi:hypothetical protein
MSRRSPPRSLSAPTEPLSLRAGVEAAGVVQVEQAAVRREQARVRAALGRPVPVRVPVAQDRPTALPEGRRHPEPAGLVNVLRERATPETAMTQACEIQTCQAGSIRHVERACASSPSRRRDAWWVALQHAFRRSDPSAAALCGSHPAVETRHCYPACWIRDFGTLPTARRLE